MQIGSSSHDYFDTLAVTVIFFMVSIMVLLMGAVLVILRHFLMVLVKVTLMVVVADTIMASAIFVFRNKSQESLHFPVKTQNPMRMSHVQSFRSGNTEFLILMWSFRALGSAV
jgi:hypothetical protein